MEENLNKSLEIVQNKTLFVGGTTAKTLKTKTKAKKTSLKKSKAKNITLKKTKIIQTPPRQSMQISLADYTVYINAIITGHGGVASAKTPYKKHNKTQLNMCGFLYSGFCNLSSGTYETEVESYFTANPIMDLRFIQGLTHSYKLFAKHNDTVYKNKYPIMSQHFSLDMLQDPIVIDPTKKTFGCQFNYGSRRKNQANKLYYGKNAGETNRHPDLTEDGPLLKILKITYKNNKTSEEIEHKSTELPMTISTRNGISLNEIITGIEKLPFTVDVSKIEITLLDLTCNVFTDRKYKIGFIEKHADISA